MIEAKQKQPIEKVGDQFLSYLRQIPYSETRISIYKRGIKKISQFMKQLHVEYYSSEIHDLFIATILNGQEYESISRNKKGYIRVAITLLQYQTNGTILYRIKQKTYRLTGEIGETIKKFEVYRRERNYSEDTIDENLHYLSQFHEYLKQHGVQTISEINSQVLIAYAKSLSIYTEATKHCALCALRVFHRYLYDEKLTETDLSYVIPKDNYCKDAKLPTTYTKEEVERLLASVDRGNPKGKRDYAMLLLAARLGLRASDICGLKFQNIIWENNLIILNQQKTKKRIELPILQEVGNAMIDYIKYGRPVSSSSFVFLKLTPPFDRLSEPTLHSIVSAYLNKAGIQNISRKKRGPHALRHSLAGVLLDKKTPLPVISEVLGHKTTESTQAYLKIDIQSLRQCALDVPPIKNQICEGEVSK